MKPNYTHKPFAKLCPRMQSPVAEANSSQTLSFCWVTTFDAEHVARDSKARLPHKLSTVCLLYHQAVPKRKRLLTNLVSVSSQPETADSD